MRLALAIASFVVLIVHGMVFRDQFFHEWERHQTAYFEQARMTDRAPRIEQILVTRFGDARVDRCPPATRRPTTRASPRIPSR